MVLNAIVNVRNHGLITQTLTAGFPGSLAKPDFADWLVRILDVHAHSYNEIAVFAVSDDVVVYERTIGPNPLVIPDRASVLFDMMFEG